MTQAGGVDLPGEVAGLVALNELVVHGWDIATASGQAYRPDEATLTADHGFLAQFSGPGNEEARGGLFGPEVAVPADAPLLDQVIGMAGRDPAGRPIRALTLTVGSRAMPLDRHQHHRRPRGLLGVRPAPPPAAARDPAGGTASPQLSPVSGGVDADGGRRPRRSSRHAAAKIARTCGRRTGAGRAQVGSAGSSVRRSATARVAARTSGRTVRTRSGRGAAEAVQAGRCQGVNARRTCRRRPGGFRSRLPMPIEGCPRGSPSRGRRTTRGATAADHGFGRRTGEDVGHGDVEQREGLPMSEVTVVRGGTIIDGTGAERATGDVAIADGRIVEIGKGLAG